MRKTEATAWTVVRLVLLLTILGSGPVLGSFSLGLRTTWRGLSAGVGQGAILVRYPGGEVREYRWNEVSPVVFAYVCYLCDRFPHRCQGHQHHDVCPRRWTGKRNKHHQKLTLKTQ